MSHHYTMMVRYILCQLGPFSLKPSHIYRYYIAIQIYKIQWYIHMTLHFIDKCSAGHHMHNFSKNSRYITTNNKVDFLPSSYSHVLFCQLANVSAALICLHGQLYSYHLQQLYQPACIFNSFSVRYMCNSDRYHSHNTQIQSLPTSTIYLHTLITKRDRTSY